MRVRCLYNENRSVPDEVRINSDFLEAKYWLLSVDKNYVVHGQALTKGMLRYLIDPEESGHPNWYPGELFEIVEGVLPSGWAFSFDPAGYRTGVAALWGYPLLVRSAEHLQGLIEREPEHLKLFLDNRSEIDAAL